MKQVLLASILAAAVSSVATFLLAEALRAPAVAPAPDPGVAALRASLEETRRELAALRASPPTTRDGAAATAVEPGNPGTPAAAAEEGGKSDPDRAARARAAFEENDVGAILINAAIEAAEPVRRDEPSAIARGSDVVQKLRGFSDWDDDADVRSRFILMREETFVGEFGKPDEIYVQESGAENWLYRFPLGTTDEEGNPEWDEVTVTFNRGRLTRIDD